MVPMKNIFLLLMLVACAHNNATIDTGQATNSPSPLEMKYDDKQDGNKHELTLGFKGVAIQRKAITKAAEIYTFNTCFKDQKLPDTKVMRFGPYELFWVFTCEKGTKKEIAHAKKSIRQRCQDKNAEPDAHSQGMDDESRASFHSDLENLCNTALPLALTP
jgi:hypothetical protein